MTDQPINLQQLRERTIVDDSGCHIWQGTVHHHGYGTIKVANRTLHVHRVIYELHNGPLPKGLPLHHLCHTKLCVNPDHLEPISRAEHASLHRAFEPAWTARAARTHCKNGHEYTVENTRWHPVAGRICRACKRAEFQRRKAKRQAVTKFTWTQP